MDAGFRDRPAPHLLDTPLPRLAEAKGSQETRFLKQNKNTTQELFFFPKNFIGGKLQNIYSTMFTVTICSELIPQNILQLKLTYLVTFKNLLLSK